MDLSDPSDLSTPIPKSNQDCSGYKIWAWLQRSWAHSFLKDKICWKIKQIPSSPLDNILFFRSLASRKWVKFFAGCNINNLANYLYFSDILYATLKRNMWMQDTRFYIIIDSSIHNAVLLILQIGTVLMMLTVHSNQRFKRPASLVRAGVYEFIALTKVIVAR